MRSRQWCYPFRPQRLFEILTRDYTFIEDVGHIRAGLSDTQDVIMIMFYRHKNCSECDDLQERLDELVIAYELVLPGIKNRDKNQNLPVLKDDGKNFTGIQSISKHIDELTSFKELWDKFQGDSCYCNDRGEVE